MKAIFPLATIFFALAAGAMLCGVPAASVGDSKGVIVGDVRVQFYADGIVRLEQKGPKGFEDKTTFTIRHRPRSEGAVELRESDRSTTLIHGSIEVVLPKAGGLKGAKVRLNGKTVFESDGTPPTPEFFPSPGSMPAAIAIVDHPRIVPPAWGAAPAPDSARSLKRTSGWSTANQALDLYVFLPKSYTDFRRDLLTLTGRIEMPPLYSFGLWHSRYHPYSDKEALEVIDTYRKKDIPLDVFVIDTDWRVGASHGYAINTKLFPDMAGFLKSAHEKKVRIAFNDHPEPVAKEALDPKELQYRYDGLAGLLKMGVDVWWYDRNWSTHLTEPAPGLPKEVWGMALFHDITQKVRPNERPLIMSNVPGIDHGIRKYAPHPSAHRYPVWWTGDTIGNFDYLRLGVENAVDAGVGSLLPYISEDLGGHYGNPSPEVYSRFFQYGALSPLTRLHCTVPETRDPWAFGPEAEQIVRDYTKLRYRLLPTLYTAAHQSYEDGTPLLQRCDLIWPLEKEAKRSDQYLLAGNLLVAPIFQTMEPNPVAVPTDLLKTPAGGQGMKGEYFTNTELSGAPQLVKIDPSVNLPWGAAGPSKEFPTNNFSARWTGALGPIPTSGTYYFKVPTEGGVRLWVGETQVIESWRLMPHRANLGSIELKAGQTYDLKLEYFNREGEPECHLLWITPDMPRSGYATREVWLPPGRWQNLWSGEIQEGPALLEVKAPLRETPMWARVGSMIVLAPEMDFAEQRPWDDITVEAFVAETGTAKQLLYEDDGKTNAYRDGAYATTELTIHRDGNRVTFEVGAAKGEFKVKVTKRSWLLRLHNTGTVLSTKVDGREAPFSARAKEGWAMPLSGKDQAVEIQLPAAPTSKSRVVEITLS